ncbi:MAG: hypothetical protein KBF50_01385 [Steroidobacteraceae bacterium]|nr:hypothetical protein [Steroidobacteraceae bacterium]
MIEQVLESSTVPLAAQLNAACQCIWVDRAKLRDQLRANLGDAASLLEARAGLVAGSVVFLAPGEATAMDRTVRLITLALSSGPFQQQIARNAPELARRPQSNAGGILGFDFHLGGPTPQLIEINTNPGGLLVNLELARAATAACDCFTEPVSVLAAAGVAIGQLEPRISDSFLAEWTSVRGEVPLRTIAIVDDEPQSQYLYAEFLLYQRLLERAGWRVVIADATSLELRDDAVFLGEERIDLIYNRVTDFYLADERHSVLRRAYESGLAVITPHPAAHARWADKRLLAWLGDDELLQQAGLGVDDRSHLRQTIPATEVVEPAAADDLWQRRKSLFFKPVDGFGSKAAYRGDKLTRTTFEHILAHRYVAQTLAPTSFRRIQSTDGAEADLRVDVRNYTMHGATWLRAARLYRGQTTNFRTAGGGFAPVLTLPA